eukprot:2427428-Pleurochrysis_carterae.AAC.1
MLSLCFEKLCCGVHLADVKKARRVRKRERQQWAESCLRNREQRVWEEAASKDGGRRLRIGKAEGTRTLEGSSESKTAAVGCTSFTLAYVEAPMRGCRFLHKLVGLHHRACGGLGKIAD